MQFFNSVFLSWLFCILCNAFLSSIMILYRKFSPRFPFKFFLICFFGGLIINTIFLNVLLLLSQETSVLVFELIEIILLQIFLIIFLRYLWGKSVTMGLFIFSCFLFSTFRLSASYFLLQMIFPEFHSLEISFPTAFFYEFFYILCISFVAVFLLTSFSKIFSKSLIYRSALTLVWGCMCFFGVALIIDLLLASFGITPYFVTYIYSFIGPNLITFETSGSFFLYTILSLMILLGCIYFGRHHGFKFLSQNSGAYFTITKYFAIGILISIMIGAWYFFLALISFSTSITLQITILFDFIPYNLTHPFWILTIIYLILLLAVFYCVYLFFLIFKERTQLWNTPNSFNSMPIFNVSSLVSIGFILCYFEYEFISPFSHVNFSFILFTIYFYLIITITLLTLYLLTYQKKSFSNLSYSLKMFFLYIPFFLGYFSAGQILSITELLFGLLSCTSLQVYAIYLQIIQNNTLDFKNLNWVIILFWGALSSCFAALLSIASLICVIIALILFYLLTYYLHKKKTITSFYGIIGTTLIIMGGTSSTFSTNILAIGIPNTIVFGIAVLILMAVLLYTYTFK